jgi:hypothetical protein
MDEFILVFLGVLVPIIIVFVSGGAKTVVFRNGEFHCHDYHLGVEFLFAHVTVCLAIFFEHYRRARGAQGKQDAAALALLNSFPETVGWLALFGIVGAIVGASLLIGYQRLKLPSLNAYGEIIQDSEGNILRVGNLLNSFGYSHDLWLGVVVFNIISILTFSLLLLWMLHHA